MNKSTSWSESVHENTRNKTFSGRKKGETDNKWETCIIWFHNQFQKYKDKLSFALA